MQRYSIAVFAIGAIIACALPHPARADAPQIVSMTLDGAAADAAFNPAAGESVDISVTADMPVKFTRLYICAANQPCDSTSGDYTRYFTSSDVADSIEKIWNGRTSSASDAPFAPDGTYRVMAAMKVGDADTVTAFGPYAITLDAAAPVSSGDATTTGAASSSAATTTTSQPPAKTTIVYVSSHESPEALSSYTEQNVFDLSAGRNRLAAVGAPIVFTAAYRLSADLSFSTCVFDWSFGDGFAARGNEVSHAYAYPGTYAVVLNGACGSKTAVARTSVAVDAPQLALGHAGDAVTVANGGADEINLGAWELRAPGKTFSFPRDTILAAGGVLTLPAGRTVGDTARSAQLFLYDPSGNSVASSAPAAETDIAAFATSSDDALADVPLPSAPVVLAAPEPPQSPAAPAAADRTVLDGAAGMPAAPEAADAPDVPPVAAPATSSPADTPFAAEPTGFWAGLLAIPSRAFAAVASFFGGW